jgi:photosystem II stability/assembly factor-like uncharacterized protein
MKQSSIISLIIFVVLIICFLPLHAQWVQVSGSYGGYTQCLTVKGKDIFAGTLDGVFRSTNSGENWTAVNSGLRNTSVTVLEAYGTNLYAGTNRGVFLSTNSGESWNAINSGLTSFKIRAFVAAPNAVGGADLFAGTSDSGAFRSTNNGSNWSAINTGLTGSFVWDFAVCSNGADSSYLFATTISHGVFRSTDKGTTWLGANEGLPSLRSMFYFVTALAVKDSSLFVAADSGIYRSINNGSTWMAIPGSPKYMMWLTATDSDLFASDGINIFRSTVNDTSWTVVSNGLPKNAFQTATVRSITLHDSKLYIPTDAGVFRSTDNGTHWANMSEGLDITPVQCLVVEGSNIYFVGQGGFNTFHSTNGGIDWTSVIGLSDYQVGGLIMSGSHVFAGTVGPKMIAGQSTSLLSSDNGASWQIINNSPAPLFTQSCGMNDKYIFTGALYGYGGVYRYSIDSSTWNPTWNKVYSGPPSWGMLPVQSVLVNGSRIYVGTTQIGIYYSPDNGTNWQAINNGLDTSTSVFIALAAEGSNIFAGTSTSSYMANITEKGIFHSTDNGAIWYSANRGLTDSNITALAVRGLKVFAATNSGGIFLSTNNGISWSPFNDGLPNPYISSVALNDSFVYAGIFGGVWKRPLSEAIVSVLPPQNDIPLSFRLEQNYPNPFNPSTNISFSLPSKSFVRLKIFDVVGREVAVVISEELTAGRYTRQWNAGRFSSGIYFYRLQTGSYTQTKKLLLLR